MIIENLGKFETADIADLESLKRITRNSGVYVLVYIENGRPKPFPRLNGKEDTDGILLIGMSKNLNERIMDFRKDVLFEDLFVHYHSEGWNFRWIFRDNTNPNAIKPKVENLRVYWKELNSEEEADSFETKCIHDYIMEYQDKPPLNISIKRKRQRRRKLS